METRTDRATAVHVDLAINIAASHGTAAGARAIRNLCRPIELALRVLLHPDQRRRPTSARPEPSSNDAPRIQHTGAAGR